MNNFPSGVVTCGDIMSAYDRAVASGVSSKLLIKNAPEMFKHVIETELDCRKRYAEQYPRMPKYWRQ